MRCQKCGRGLGLIHKSCPKCGTAVPPEIKKKAWLEFLGVLILAVLAAFIYTGYFYQTTGGATNPINTTSNLVFGLTVSTLLFFAALYLLASFIKFLIHRPIIGVTVLVILIVASIVIMYGVGGSNYKKAKELLPVFQDSLAEVTAAKIMGDSIKSGHPTSGASMEKVKSSAQTVVERLKDITDPSMLRDYQQRAIDWSNKIIAATKGTTSWNKLANQPGNFNLRISDNQAKELFSASVTNIQILKEFGDNAIKKKDRDAMRYIAAKLLVQNHWLNGILHSKNTGLFAINFTSPVFASNQDPMRVPDIGPVEDVTCSICNNSSYHMTADQRRMYGCDTRCRPQQKPTQPTQPKSQQPAQQSGQNQNQPQTSPDGTNSVGTPPGSKTETVNQPQEEFKYGQTIRNICLDITGVAGSYCAQAAEQFTQEIAASAIGFAEGVGGAEEVWNEKWKAESGIGITFGAPDVPATSKHSPIVQTFYDECGAKGSSVGGANQDKGRLLTTEGGYHCNYKQGANNCWDFLTNSGGRYMGGDVGCEEKNLMPVASNQTPVTKTQTTPQPTAKTSNESPSPAPAPKPAVPKQISFDGSYVGLISSCHCIIRGTDTYNPCMFDENLPFSPTVVNSVIKGGYYPTNTVMSINSSGEMFYDSGQYKDAGFDIRTKINLVFYDAGGGKIAFTGKGVSTSYKKMEGNPSVGIPDWIRDSTCQYEYTGTKVSN